MKELLWKWLMRWVIFLNLIFAVRAEHKLDLYFAIKARMGRINERFPSPKGEGMIKGKPIEKAKALCNQFTSIQLKNQCTVIYIRYKLLIDCREKVMEELSKDFENIPNATMVYYDKDTIEDHYVNIPELEGICFYRGVGDYEGSFTPQRKLIEEKFFPSPPKEESSKDHQKDLVVLDEDVVYANLLKEVGSFVMNNIERNLMSESTVLVDQKKRKESNVIKVQPPLETVVINCRPVGSLSLYEQLDLEREFAIYSINRLGLYRDCLDKELEKCIETESSHYKNLSREEILKLFPTERPVFKTMSREEKANWWTYQAQFMTFIKIGHKLLVDSVKLEQFTIASTDYNFFLQAAKIFTTTISTTGAELENYFYEPCQKRLDKIQTFLMRSSCLISEIKFEEPQIALRKPRLNLKKSFSNSKKSKSGSKKSDSGLKKSQFDSETSEFDSKKSKSGSKKSQSGSKKSQFDSKKSQSDSETPEFDLKTSQPRPVFNDQKGYANQFDVETNLFSGLFQFIDLKNAFIKGLSENDLAGWDRAYQTGPIPSLVTIFCNAKRLGALLLILKSPQLMQKASLANIIKTFDQSIGVRDGEEFHNALSQLNILIRHLDNFVKTHEEERKNIKVETII